MKITHTSYMPWDDLIDYSYYKVSCVRIIKYRIIKKEG